MSSISINNLTGQVAVITGGTRGIGRAIAEAFLAAGAKVVINGRSPEKGQRTLAELDAGSNALFAAGNVQDQQDVERVVRTAIEKFGKVDILVNNAGGSSGFAPVAEMSNESWQEAAAWILHSALWASRLALQDMTNRGYGRIINISSVSGIIGNPGQGNYAASKAGMIGMTKSLAREAASRGITANCIAPGFIQTAMTDVLNEKQQSEIMAAIPAQKFGTPEDIAATAVYLASEEANYVTGQTLHVNGGMVMP